MYFEKLSYLMNILMFYVTNITENHYQESNWLYMQRSDYEV
jgi:hypothetical protein